MAAARPLLKLPGAQRAQRHAWLCLPAAQRAGCAGLFLGCRRENDHGPPDGGKNRRPGGSLFELGCALQYPHNTPALTSQMVSPTTISLKVRIRRKPGWQDFHVTLPASAYVLDVLEEIEKQDPSVLFRHACHHASCGSCGLRVNGRERLACVTPLAEVTRQGAAFTPRAAAQFSRHRRFTGGFQRIYGRVGPRGHAACPAGRGHSSR